MKKTRIKLVFSTFIAFTGYLLSPLSWWNDLFINVPLAYLFALPFSMINKKFFLYAFVIGYWMTNLAGLILMHRGIRDIISPQKRNWNWKNSLLTSLIYTLIIVWLVRNNFVPVPSVMSK